MRVPKLGNFSALNHDVVAAEVEVAEAGTTEVASRAGAAAAEGGRVFWSGGNAAKQAAASFAERTGGTTLEMTSAGRALEGAQLPWAEAKPLWQEASREFATGAQGQVDVFMSRAARPDSIWRTIERPALESNAAVNSIRFHLTVVP
jgi:hypothetical protein